MGAMRCCACRDVQPDMPLTTRRQRRRGGELVMRWVDKVREVPQLLVRGDSVVMVVKLPSG
jgi:hypothetical protein